MMMMMMIRVICDQAPRVEKAKDGHRINDDDEASHGVEEGKGDDDEDK